VAQDPDSSQDADRIEGINSAMSGFDPESLNDVTPGTENVWVDTRYYPLIHSFSLVEDHSLEPQTPTHRLLLGP
jgi:hypothetical protein